jgi:hypothetical protein
MTATTGSALNSQQLRSVFASSLEESFAQFTLSKGMLVRQDRSLVDQLVSTVGRRWSVVMSVSHDARKR